MCEYSPNVLNGLDAYQHLPGILNELGYFTVEIGLPKYVDAYEVNMQDGFDVVNQHFISNDLLLPGSTCPAVGRCLLFSLSYFRSCRGSFAAYFLYPHHGESLQACHPAGYELNIGDRQRINQLLELINTTDEPLFVHMHLMGTHGPMFYPSHQTYSAGEKQEAEWQDDFYDDAILDFDAYIKDVRSAFCVGEA